MNSRTIVVKTLLNADEYLEFQNRCKANDIPHSRILRTLANNWASSTNHIRARRRIERPIPGQKMAIFPNRNMRL
ncbi:hypothetical protein [Undibacterium sp. TJN19]|uniref:hypothetical protein n=1 Tax=Undibacterium sp. TJN19 TaxID=3413055 RepID=UPI003BEF6011